MPVIFAAVPVAALLAWLAMKAGGPRRAARTPMTAGGGLEGGDTGRLGTGREQEEKWRREELPFERPSATGGEVGGPYGPESNAEPPSAITSYEAPPGPTQTVLIGPTKPEAYPGEQAWQQAHPQSSPARNPYSPEYRGPSSPAPAAPTQARTPYTPPVYHAPPTPAPAPAPRYGGVIRAE